MKSIYYKFFLILLLATISNSVKGQEMNRGRLDSLKYAIIHLEHEVTEINTNLALAKKTLKTGVFIATLGYTVTIVGGQLLGVNPELGEALLYAGGAIGIGGTFVLVNGFNKIHIQHPK